jgi:glycosyltransferase involved in cell wall biosynthesis
MTTFSVLICTYNRPDMLEMALKALIDRTAERPDQVIVVNGGDERSDRIVQTYKDNSAVKVELVKTVNKNLATSRNIGLAYCTGDIVAMTDDDAEVYPDWVTQMKKAHAEHLKAGGVGGAVIGADSDKSLLSRIADVVTFSTPPQPGYVSTIAGVNVSYKRSVLMEVGLQDETLFRGEDVDFNWRIKKLGY